MRHIRIGFRIGLPALLTALAASASAQQVGTTGAVNPAAQSAPPGGSLRTMNVGANVVFKERINTSAVGSVQLIFVDRTTMNVGPNSQLTIDEFVYDPAANTGRITATLTKGVMRFVGGQTSHTGGATIKTPATTLGVRGGVVTVRHDQQNGTRAINHYGIITAQTQNGQEVIRRPGFALNVASVNTAPTAPRRAPQTEIDGNNKQLTSAGGQTGGRREVPTDAGASKAVGETNRQVTTNVVEGQKQTTSQSAQFTSSQPATTATSDMLQRVQQTAFAGAQQQQVSTLQALSGATKPATQLPKRRFYAMNGTTISGTLVPVGFVASGPAYESMVLGYGPGGLDANGAPNTSSRVLHARMVISGAGPGQASTLVGMWAGVYDSPQSEFILDGGVRGTTRLSSTAAMGRLSGSIASTLNGVTLDTDYSPVSATVNQNSFNSAGIRTSETSFYYTGTGSSSTYTYSAALSRTESPTGLGAVRPTVELTGFTAGLMRTSSNTLNAFVGPSFPVWGDNVIALSQSARFQAGFDVWRVGSSTATADNFSYGTNLFGYMGEGTGARSTYVDYSNFLAAESAYRDTNQRLSTVNGANVLNQHALMVNNETVNARSFFPGVTFCVCEYGRWGFWSSDTQRAGLTSTGAPDTVRDRVHMGTWTATVPTTHIEVPTTGSATYVGHIIGSFKTGSSEYIAAGNYQNTVNFGTNSGSFSISNLDGRNYAGSVSINSSDRVYFSGSGITTAGPSAYISTFGSFARGVSGPVGEMNGLFKVDGSGYIGSGTFMARQ